MQSFDFWTAAWQAGVIFTIHIGDITQLIGSLVDARQWQVHSLKAAQAPSPPQ
jgi:hypothetical protein